MSRESQATDDSDAALLSLSAAGDRSAFDRLASRHLGRTWRLALRVTGDPGEAEEVAQEAMLRAWRSAGRYDPEKGAFTAWLHRIVVNLAADRRRAARPGQAALADAIADPAPAACVALENAQRRRLLAAGLAALPERQLRAVSLAYIEERAGTEAAASLGISTRALEGLLRRARRFLREWVHAREA